MATAQVEGGRRAAIYARISEDRNGDELGVRRQLQDCRELCSDRGFAVAREYVDNDISASNGRKRPEYERLLEDLRTGRVDVVVAWHADRLHRRPDELEEFIRVIEGAGASVATVRAGELDLATATGRLVARLLGATARHEVELKSERQRRKHRELAEAGRPTGGGDRPFGFELDRITVRASEAREIKDAARRILAGGSLRSVVADWNTRDVKSPRGGPWPMSSARRMLMSGRIAGLREHRGAIVAKATWPSIVTERDHQRLVAILGDPRRRTAASNARSYLLTGGLARCGRCGAAMVARPSERKQRRYACTKESGGCNRMFHVAETLESFVRDALIAALDGPGLELVRRAQASTVADDDQAISDELAGIHARIDELASAYAEGSVPLQAFQSATRDLEARRDQLRAQLAKGTPARLVGELPSGAEALESWWDRADLVSRRELVGAVIERVVVGPAIVGRNTFDPSRVDLVWRA